MRTPLGEELRKQVDAQEVFHQVLLPQLAQREAKTIEEIVAGGLSVFRLKLEPNELRDLLELARRRGLIEPLGSIQDVYGDAIEDTQWLPSQLGRELKRPTAVTVGAVLGDLRKMLPAGTKTAPVLASGLAGLAVVLPFIGPLVGVSSSPQSDGMSTKTWVIVAAGIGLLCLGIALQRGMRGDAQLRHAARAWERLHKTWPCFWRLQVSWQRPWVGLLGGLMVVAPFVVRLLGVGEYRWLTAVYLFGVVTLAVLAGVWGYYSNKRQPSSPVPGEDVPVEPKRALAEAAQTGNRA
jgi:hypothetical protein